MKIHRIALRLIAPLILLTPAIAADTAFAQFRFTRIADTSGRFATVGSPALNDAGQVAFEASSGQTFATGIFVGAGRAVTTVADTSGLFSALDDQPRVNALGQAAFGGFLRGGGAGVFVGAGGALTRIADANGAFRDFAEAPSLNDRGAVAFGANLKAGGGGIFVSEGGQVRTFADSSGLFDNFLGFQQPIINNRGQVAFAGSLDDGQSGLFVGPDPFRNRVVMVGDALDSSTLTRFQFFGEAFNNAGQLVFSATFADGRTGIFRADPATAAPEPTALGLWFALYPVALLRFFAPIFGRSRPALALAGRGVVSFLALFALALLSGRSAMALPQFSRMYKVPCSTCHTVAPNLNSFGYAFQANHFNWAGTVAATGKKESPLIRVPISLIATAVAERDYVEKSSNSLFEAVEVYGANGFQIPTKADAAVRNGGYFVNAFGIVGRQAAGIHAGDLEDAYASLPVYGQRGELAVTFGQTTPMMYQYDPVNSLTDALPIALGNEDLGDPLSFTEAVPTVRLDYFDNRAKGGADGNYVSLGFPFGGRFTLNRYATLRKSRGVYLHGFHRYQGYNTFGAFGHLDGKNNVGGLIATYAPLPGKINLLGVGSIGKGEENPTARQLSIEANYTPLTYLALSGRVEALDAEERHGEIITVETLTFAPFQYQTLRITVEATQGRALRGIAAIARIQL